MLDTISCVLKMVILGRLDEEACDSMSSIPLLVYCCGSQGAMKEVTSHHVTSRARSTFHTGWHTSKPPPTEKSSVRPNRKPLSKMHVKWCFSFNSHSTFLYYRVRMNSKEGFQAIIIGRSPAGGLWRCPIWLLGAGGIWRSHVSLVWFADESSSAERETEKRTKLVSSSPESSEPLM